ncbi:hypothetical protein [Streptomyces sp. NRRL F-5135]|uniref:hypothetical protein n=1 Tax=Streptomyces sp. NRRL F-5135 TaxID=1463858 RepID=UPI0004C65FD5|nr:hypothetical protein [Streptomyces sp. NRRL F-5135]
MSYLLHIDASSLGEASVSRQVARSFRDEWKVAVVHRDLAVSPAPHLSAAGITVRTTDPAEHTPELTMAPHVPMLAPLLPMHEASMTKSHDEARRLGSALTGRPAA